MKSDLIGRLVKIVWEDAGNSKVVIGNLISAKGKFIELKTLEEQIFIINFSKIVSLFEYRSEGIKDGRN